MSESEKKDKVKKHPPQKEPKGSSEEIRLSKKEHEDLLGKISELEGIREQLLRSAADYENAKKRLQREKEDFVKFSQEGLIKNLLPIMDNFERALAHAGEDKEHNLDAVVKGIHLVLKQLLDLLKSQGLEKVETVGHPFDPHRHEAVAYVQEAGKEDEIVDEIEPGYTLHGRLLRAAKVRVRVSPAGTVRGFGASDEKPEEIT